MAKTQEDLQESRKIREMVLNKYGFIPTSVIEPDYSWGKDIIEFEERKQQVKAEEKHSKMKYNIKSYTKSDGTVVEYNETQEAFSMSSQNVRGKQSGVSTFPPGLAKFIVEFYSNRGDTILDPCAGHNSRMQVTFSLDRNYIGYDVSKVFMEFNRKVKEQITTGQLFQSAYTITLREQSSEKMLEDSNSIDMIYTSPPYYCVEWYGDEPEQLGLSGSYEKFLERIKVIIAECYRVLKKDKYCIFNINDFRMDNKFFPYHADIMKLFVDVGFKLHDVIIVKWKSCIGQCFASQIEERKMAAKAHEYLVVGKKI